MWFRQVLTVTILAAQWSISTLASPLQQRSDNVCSSGIYGELSPILKGFAIAQEFCADFFPPKCASAQPRKRYAEVEARFASTTTTAQAKTTAAITTTAKAKTTATTITKIASTTSKAASTTKSMDKTSSAWSKCQSQPHQVISTLCSCIEYHKPCTTTKATTKSTTASVTVITTTKKAVSTTPVTTTPIVPSTTTPIITTPVITTPVITTPVITTPIVTTPVITTKSTTTTPCDTEDGVACPTTTTTTPIVTTPVITTPIITTATTTSITTTTPLTTTSSAAMPTATCGPNQPAGPYGCTYTIKCNAYYTGDLKDYPHVDSLTACLNLVGDEHDAIASYFPDDSSNPTGSGYCEIAQPGTGEEDDNLTNVFQISVDNPSCGAM